MEINLNPNLKPVVPAPPASSKAQEVKAARDGATFEHTATLHEALSLTPTVRKEKVDLGRQLVASINYPPPEMINRIANLLAMKIDNTTPSKSDQ